MSSPHRVLSLLPILWLAACAATTGPGTDPDPDAGTIENGPDAAPVAQNMFVHSPDTLYRIDDQSFDLVLIGPFGLDEEELMTDLAVTPDGNIYGISRTNLYSIDADTGAASHIAEVSSAANVGMTFLDDGTLLATDDTGGVRQIDPASGEVTEVGHFGELYATAGDLVGVFGGAMFAISDKGPEGDEQDNNLLLTVDPETGTGFPVGQIGYNRVFGCAVANGKIYAFTSPFPEDGEGPLGEVIEIDPVTGAGELVRTHPVEFWGAGVTPLAIVD